MLQCYNKGCLQEFDPKENTDKSCTYHPGNPVFHDVYKSWSCCNKKTSDFTVFLSTKGCAQGPHNPEKPVETTKVDEKKASNDKVIIMNAPKPPKCAPRLPSGQPRRKLPVTIAQSLKSHLLKVSTTSNGESEESGDGEIPIGTQCKNPGCIKAYDKAICHSDDSCLYHNGTAIFHEGMKYWSCCQRKTSDFEAFMQQAGCTSGKHVWRKEHKDKTAMTSCRYDWHQTGPDLYVTIYSKLPQPGETFVECNAVNLWVHVDFEDGKSLFELHVPLWGAIDIDNSLVTLSAAKVEVRMKKRDPISWPRLNYIEEKTED